MNEAPEHWLRDHGDALYRYALKLTRDPHAAEEAVQETLLAALEARAQFRGASNLRTWLIAILKRKLADQLRREARETPVDPALLATEADDDGFDASGRWRTPPADWGDPEALLAQEQFLSALQRCVGRLPKPMADLFMLREVLEEDTENICKELAISPTNLWTTLHRTRLRLRQCLERSWSWSGTTASG